MEFMTKWNLGLQALFIAAVILTCAIIFCLGAAFFKPRISQKAMTYIYAFSCGFVLPLGVYGLLGGAYGHLDEHFKDTDTGVVTKNALTMVVICLSTALACAIYFFSRHFLVKSEIHDEHVKHAHPEHAVNLREIGIDRKWLAIIFVLMHRVPAGLTLGLLIYGLNNGGDEVITLGLLITFIVHIIPESLIVYYRQIEIGKTPMQALVNTIIAKFVLVPFMFIGVYFAKAVDSVYWLFPAILAVCGTLMTLTVVLELLPEFMHGTIDSNKGWHKVVMLIMIGFVLACLLLVIHHH